jgi:hypothetical protein
MNAGTPFLRSSPLPLGLRHPAGAQCRTRSVVVSDLALQIEVPYAKPLLVVQPKRNTVAPGAAEREADPIQ